MADFFTFIQILNGSRGVRLVKRVALCVWALVLAGCAGIQGPGEADITDFNRVVVDAGHGGHDSGALSRGRGLGRSNEKDLTLDVARRVARRLDAAGFNTVMSRDSDRFIPLDERAAISNRHKKSVFVSIHFNDSRKRSIQGAEVYHNGRGTYGLTRKVAKSLGGVPGCRVRFIKTAQFRVLRKSVGSALLVECGYMSNAAELARCSSAAYRDRLAEAIAQAIIAQRRSGVAAVVAD